jgi:hypothetical protein
LRPLILQPYWTRKKVLRNALGLAFDEEARCAEGGRLEPKQQAHVLQGIEVQSLLAVMRAYPDDIQLLEHDGFVSRRDIPKHEIERLVKAETGFDLTLFCELNTRPT